MPRRPLQRLRPMRRALPPGPARGRQPAHRHSGQCRGGWDQTGRALGAALACGAADRVEYENLGGKGGTIGLAQFVERHGQDPDALLIGGMVMVGAVALQSRP